eukprot:1050734-Pelagomonas_calceolata.AAC.1
MKLHIVLPSSLYHHTAAITDGEEQAATTNTHNVRLNSSRPPTTFISRSRLSGKQNIKFYFGSATRTHIQANPPYQQQCSSSPLS